MINAIGPAEREDDPKPSRVVDFSVFATGKEFQGAIEMSGPDANLSLPLATAALLRAMADEHPEFADSIEIRITAAIRQADPGLVG